MTPEPTEQHGLSEELVRDRSIRLFTFLKELAELRSRTVRSYDQYEHVLWFHEIPRYQGCHCIAWRATPDDEASDAWVEVSQPRFKKPPDLPTHLKAWIDPDQLQDSSLQTPSIRDHIIVEKATTESEGQFPNPTTEIVHLINEAELRGLIDRYIEEKWIPWAEEDRKLREVQKVYADLFSIYQKQQRLGEAYEVVLGLGCLSWKLPSAQEVRRHLVTCQISINFDAKRGVISLGPSADGPRPTLEQDMLEPQERPDSVEQVAIEQQVQGIGDAIWDGVHVPTALKSWAQAVSSYGQYADALEPPGTMSEHPHVTLGPAMVLRRRTDKNLIYVYQEIIRQLKEGQDIPIGVRRLVSIVDDRDRFAEGQSDTPSHNANPLTPGEVYFPLPANNEQRQIVHVLTSRQGVLVQGPPGTGKSHTITNLVCHLLASGKRVLITSHTQRALRVLLEKFERESHLKEIARLCVILLGDDIDSRKALEDSVQSVLDHYNRWDREQSRQKISKLERELNQRRQEEASALRSLRTIREAETYRHESLFGTYSGTAREIAIRIREENGRYGWIPLESAPDQELPITDDEAITLLELLRSIPIDTEHDLKRTALDLDGLPTPSEFQLMLDEEMACKVSYEEAKTKRDHPAYDGFARLSTNDRQEVLQRLTYLATGYDNLSKHIHDWASLAATQILGERDRSWRHLLAVTKKYLARVELQHRKLGNRKVSGLDEQDFTKVREQAGELHAHFLGGGSTGFWVFQHKTVRKSRFILEQIRIDGQPCDNIEALETLLRWTDILESLRELQTLWSSHTSPPLGPIEIQIAEYHDLCEPIEAGIELLSHVRIIKESLSRFPGFHQPAWHKIEEIRQFVNAGHSVHATESLEAIQKSFTNLENKVANYVSLHHAHPTSKHFLDAIRARDGKRYEAVFTAIQNLLKKQALLEQRSLFLNKLRLGAPLLAKQLVNQFQNPEWNERMASLALAWNWARASRWIEQLGDPTAYRRLTYSLDASRRRIEEILGMLASEKAWAFCIERIDEPQRQHLVAWHKAVERIGKGKGKATHVAKNRSDARHHMQACRAAIPAWIMPIYRVAESFIPGKDVFDVVIVDEASQSGPEALFLQYLARQVIVVGDDKQISPENVGLTKEDVNLLRERNIKDLPHSDFVGIDHSFFELAELRYGGRIRLREHFRCMPEIIQFSNNLCYASQPLIPLRQFGTGRLQPVLRTEHVQSGYQRGHSPKVDNPPEAEAIARQIQQCCEDPAYLGKTFGVISLLGELHARTIEKHLLNWVGPSEMKKRDLICGDAYAFQGDERDIMFLSLVAAPADGKRITTLASPKDVKRFNVAASRAKDQMWLFHSATLNDLSPQCLRYQLLSYFIQPQVRSNEIEGMSINDIRLASHRADRRNDSPPSPFDSWFEVDVFLRITDRQYRVIPQVEVAGYFIDLVVEGMNGRLAVECDGDQFHGLEQFDADMARQRMLERCGLHFYRIQASSYYRDEDSALDDLWDLLKQKNIHSGDTEAPSASRPSTHQQPAPDTSLNSEEHKVNNLSDMVQYPPPSKWFEMDPSWFKSDQPTIQNTLFPASKSMTDTLYEPFGAGPISTPASWFRMSHWGKVTQHLTAYLNRFAYDIGSRLTRQTTFSEKQIKLAQKTWNDALTRGFNPVDKGNGLTDRQEQNIHGKSESMANPEVSTRGTEETESAQLKGGERSDKPYSDIVKREKIKSTALTDREREILQLIWAGFKNEEIGLRLKISVKTVEAHRANMMRKMGVTNVAELLRIAIHNGVLKTNT
ncbi:MAG: DNA helicase [Nitrospira sp.]|nr:DNA helicase [Nitrospira sp.]